MSDFAVVRDHPDLLLYIDSQQRKNATALSFYPKSLFEREYTAGRLLLGLLNGEPAGYIWHGAPGGIVACHQVCIQYDARRRLYGAMLVAALEQDVLGSEAIQLRCGFDLEANDFWHSLGYDCVGRVPGGARRMRTLNIWRKQLVPLLIPFETIEPAVGKMDSRAWTKSQVRGTSPWARGKRLADFRAAVNNV